MSFKMTVWENRNGKLAELEKHKLDKEERLEDWIEQDSSILGLDVLFIGRQVHTPYSGKIDLLAIDGLGNLVIIELKRDKTPRDVVAQVLDYASWVNELQEDEIRELSATYLKKTLTEAFFERFAIKLPEALNQAHRMVIVASELDDSSERIVQYLSAVHSLDINVVFFSCFNQGGKELVGRSWLMDPVKVEAQAGARRWPISAEEYSHDCLTQLGVSDKTVVDRIMLWAKGQGLELLFRKTAKLSSFRVLPARLHESSGLIC
jgi:hypothetical protein